MNRQTTIIDELERGVERHPASLGTIGARIGSHAEVQPDHPAIVASGFAPLSYRELQCQIDNTRAALRRAGFGYDSRIAVAMPNGPHAAMAIVAVSCSAVCVPLNPRQTLPEIGRCLAAIRLDAIVLMKDEASAARQAAQASGVTVLEVTPPEPGTFGLDIGDLPIATTSDEHDEPPPETAAFILQTSGTTADSKLIPTSHRNMIAAAARVQIWFDLTPQDRCLSVSPVYYAHGLHVTVFAVLLSGGAVAFPVDTSKLDFAEWFEDLKPTWYSAGPTLHRLVLDQIQSEPAYRTKHALRFVVSGGAPLPLEVQAELRRLLDVPVLEHYGSSEGMQICANQLPPGRSSPGTCGVPWPGTIKIVGDDGAQLPPGKMGEILVGGPTVVSGYLNAPEITSASFVNGWFKSRDIGSIDSEGFLTLHGRKNDIINRGGEKVSPSEIDNVLMTHPSVADAAAFAVPHPRLGEDVAAVVVLHPGVNATSRELRRYLEDRLALFKVPRHIIFRDKLPKGATGKVLRRQLTETWQYEPPAIPAGAPILDDGKMVDLVVPLTAIWERLLKTAPITLDDDFFEKGGDSLLAVDMLAELDRLTGKTVPNFILLDASTIRQLAQKLSERHNLEPKRLVEINRRGTQPPLIFFHGHFVFGGGRLTVELTKLLGEDQPILVVIPHGAGEAFPESIETMAAERLPLILQSQPEGPYRLCGYCLGGIVAFETARLLIAAGKDVEMVVMIDPPTISARRSVQLFLSKMNKLRPLLGDVVDRAMAWTWYRCADVQRAWNVSWTRRWAAVKTRIRYLVSTKLTGEKNVEAGSALRDLDLPPIGNFADSLTSNYAGVMSRYLPKPLDVRVIYIAIDYGIGAWRRVSPDYKVIRSRGHHYAFEVSEIADVLRVRSV